jgi:carbamoyl-phosphate synthase large subunit
MTGYQEILSDPSYYGQGMLFTTSHVGNTSINLGEVNLPLQLVNKVSRGSPNVVDLIRSGKVNLILNTSLDSRSHSDGADIRAAATAMNVPLLTTLSAAAAAVSAIRALGQKELKYRSLQQHFTM